MARISYRNTKLHCRRLPGSCVKTQQQHQGDVDGTYHDALDLALDPEFAHDALQLSLPLLRQLLAAEVVPGLVQQLRWLCWHLLQRVLLQLTLCEDCSTSEPVTQPGLVLQGLQCICCTTFICSAY